MKFQEIFQQEGLYKSDSFSKGVVFKIKKNPIDNRLELYIVTYKNSTDILPKEEPQIVYDGLFNKNYIEIFNKKELFE